MCVYGVCVCLVLETFEWVCVTVSVCMTLWVASIAQSVQSRPLIKFQGKFPVTLLLKFEENSTSPFYFKVAILLDFEENYMSLFHSKLPSYQILMKITRRPLIWSCRFIWEMRVRCIHDASSKFEVCRGNGIRDMASCLVFYTFCWKFDLVLWPQGHQHLAFWMRLIRFVPWYQVWSL